MHRIILQPFAALGVDSLEEAFLRIRAIFRRLEPIAQLRIGIRPLGQAIAAGRLDNLPRPLQGAQRFAQQCVERRGLLFCRRGKGAVGPGKELPPGQRRPLAQLAKQKGRSPLPLGDGIRRLQDAQIAALALGDIAAGG